jgi:UDP-2,3-diacylglucosamine pyrophosphatase LpxH
MKIYLASDMHIGFEGSNYSAIMEFFELVQNDATELILLGDIFELWTNTYDNSTNKEPYKSAYDSLMKTSSRVPTTIVCGNHDYNLRKFIRNPNIRIEDRFTRGKCRFMHGWEFDATQVTAFPFFETIMEVFPSIYQKYFYKPQEDRKLALSQNDITNAVAKEYAQKREFKYLFYGHTHEPSIDGSLVNCGDFVEHATFVIIKDDGVELWKI